MMARRSSLALLLLLPSMLQACVTAGSAAGVHPEAAPAGDAPLPLRTGGEEAGVAMSIGPGDVFEVKVFQDKDLSGTFKVGPEGTINFPLIGELVVMGLTPNRVAESIRKQLSEGFIREPVVSVLLKESQSKKIFVFGQVTRPGTFVFSENMSILQAIAVSGGFTNLAAKDSTYVTRREGGLERKYTIPITRILDGARSNFLLKPGDIVFVPESIF
ncbi:MAG: polysaccharide export protein [Deltaproteobacteria bacterium]|nr:polysaccharide export protein [Deltaproteobacteria bacterium]